jgi:hypothetical protein
MSRVLPLDRHPGGYPRGLPGECVRFEVQKSANGVRPDFAASGKDVSNVSTDGGWIYYVAPS